MSNSNSNTLYTKHKAVIDAAIEALAKRDYYTPYPEHPKAYSSEDKDVNAEGKDAFGRLLNEDFKQPKSRF